MIRHRTLALGAAMLAALATACVDQPAPAFSPEGTGSISGLLFYDADNNGQFTPVGGDTLLSGVSIRLMDRADEDVLASTTTSASGTFTFAGVPLGTHSLQVVDDPNLTGSLVFCVNPLPATVYRDENRFLSVAGKLGCVIPIDSAESLPQGADVTVAGIVTAAQGRYRGDNAAIQDLTGGIVVFGLSSALGLVEGDSIEVSGVLGNFGGEPQVTLPRVTTIKRAVGEEEPVDRTVAQVSGVTPTSADVGRLIRIRGVEMGAFAANFNASGTDATGTIQVRLDGNAQSAIGTAYFTTGNCYDLTGILGSFNGTPQLKPRTRADVVGVPCP